MFTLTQNFDSNLWTWGLGDLKKLSSLDFRL